MRHLGPTRLLEAAWLVHAFLAFETVALCATANLLHRRAGFGGKVCLCDSFAVAAKVFLHFLGVSSHEGIYS